MSKGIPISDEDLSAVLELVADGKFLKEACAELGVHYVTVWRRCSQDPDWSRRYQMAKEAFGDARASDIAQFVKECPDPKRADVIAKHERWAIEAMARTGFGQKKQIELSGPGGGPIELSGKSEGDLARLLSSKMKQLGVRDIDELVRLAERSAPKRLPQIIDGEVSSPATPEG